MWGACRRGMYVQVLEGVQWVLEGVRSLGSGVGSGSLGNHKCPPSSSSVVGDPSSEPHHDSIACWVQPFPLDVPGDFYLPGTTFPDGHTIKMDFDHTVLGTETLARVMGSESCQERGCEGGGRVHLRRHGEHFPPHTDLSKL